MKSPFVLALLAAIAVELANFLFVHFPVDVGLTADAGWFTPTAGRGVVVLHLPGIAGGKPGGADGFSAIGRVCDCPVRVCGYGADDSAVHLCFPAGEAAGGAVAGEERLGGGGVIREVGTALTGRVAFVGRVPGFAALHPGLFSVASLREGMGNRSDCPGGPAVSLSGGDLLQTAIFGDT